MFHDIKERVLNANLELVKKGLVIYTWGNVSEIDRKRNIVAIKPSGVEYDKMVLDDIVIVDLEGNVIEGNLKPSSDLKTHLELYKHFEIIGGVVHTHSKWATIWAQANLPIPALGTTHADYYYGEIPCTRYLNSTETRNDYEKNTGLLICEYVKDVSAIPSILVAGHGPFTWGKDSADAVYNAVVLEEIANMAYHTLSMNKKAALPQYILEKHYYRKHGKNAYYGQIK